MNMMFLVPRPLVTRRGVRVPPVLTCSVSVVVSTSVKDSLGLAALGVLDFCCLEEYGEFLWLCWLSVWDESIPQSYIPPRVTASLFVLSRPLRPLLRSRDLIVTSAMPDVAKSCPSTSCYTSGLPELVREDCRSCLLHSCLIYVLVAPRAKPPVESKQDVQASRLLACELTGAVKTDELSLIHI